MIKNIIFNAFFLIVPCILLAQSPVKSDTTKVYNLNPITVTATKTETPRNLVSPSISVIPADEINANPEESIFSLISQEVPGVFVTERDVLGFGINTPSGQINIRGIGESQNGPNNEVLTLIDGRPQYMGWYGHPIDDSYLSANIERIEVIRGPASMLYGSNAMGGVINIITHSSQQNGLEGNASVSYGSYDAQQYGMHLGYQENDWNILGSFTHEHTDGSRPWSEYTANSGYLKTSDQLNEQYKVSLDGSYTQFNTFDPGQVTQPYTNNWMHIQRGYIGAALENDFGASKGGISFVYNLGHNELSPGDPNYSWISNDHQIIATAYQTLNMFTGNTINAGIDVQQNGGTASNTNDDFGKHSIQDYAGYVSVQQIFFDRLLANAGIRYAYNTYFGDIAIPQAGITYKLTEETNIRASVGRGYRAPQIFEIYQLIPRDGTLQPEDLWNYEIGVSHQFGHCASIDVAGYVIDAQNTIVDTWYAKESWNTGGFHRDGVECSAQLLPFDRFTINANYSFTDKPDISQAVPKHKAFIGGEYRYNILTFLLSAQYVNTIYGTDQTDYMLKQLSDYTNVEIRVAAQVTEKISLSIGSRNILNESYQTIYGYPMPGRTFNVGIKAGI
ncbi:MAG: TonB-dependent receptor [Bacteroidota bacterium]